MFLAISAVISGIDDWKGIEMFGKSKLDWLRKFFPYKNGIPWHGTLGRLFAQLDNEAFESAFIEWVAALGELNKGEVVAFDGKRMRGSYDKSDGKAAIHMVSAYASSQRLCLGQLATEEKSNEITAIPQLLDLLTLEGCTVTIDAMGCQKDISEKIIKKNADYILQVKDNQKGLSEQIDKLFNITQTASCHTSNDIGHGRVEQRTCHIINDLTFLDDYKDWPGLKTLVRVQARRIDKRTDKEEKSTRYYISSKKADAEVFNQDIRSHWAIENQLHWVLDVTFGEDASRKRKGNSAKNFSLFTKMAMALIEKCEDQNSDNLTSRKLNCH
jgi:predicted transposase YbfD/YdcC